MESLLQDVQRRVDAFNALMRRHVGRGATLRPYVRTSAVWRYAIALAHAGEAPVAEGQLHLIELVQRLCASAVVLQQGQLMQSIKVTYSHGGYSAPSLGARDPIAQRWTPDIVPQRTTANTYVLADDVAAVFRAIAGVSTYVFPRQAVSAFNDVFLTSYHHDDICLLATGLPATAPSM